MLDAFWDRHRDGVGHESELGLGAPRRDGHHAVASREALDPGPDLDDDTGKLEAGDVDRGAGGRRIVARPLKQIRPVQACGVHFDEQFALSRNRRRPVFHFDFSLGDDDGTHRPHCRAPRMRPPPGYRPRRGRERDDPGDPARRCARRQSRPCHRRRLRDRLRHCGPATFRRRRRRPRRSRHGRRHVGGGTAGWPVRPGGRRPAGRLGSGSGEGGDGTGRDRHRPSERRRRRRTRRT